MKFGEWLHSHTEILRNKFNEQCDNYKTLQKKIIQDLNECTYLSFQELEHSMLLK